MDGRLYNSLTEGDFGNGKHCSQSLVEGDFWARRSSCYCMYRGKGNIDNIDYNRIILCVPGEDKVIELPDNIQHENQTEYFYSIRNVSPTGKQEKGTEAIVKIST